MSDQLNLLIDEIAARQDPGREPHADESRPADATGVDAADTASSRPVQLRELPGESWEDLFT